MKLNRYNIDRSMDGIFYTRRKVMLTFKKENRF